MGMFKGLKDMKSMLGAAPGLLDQANQLSANAQVMQAQAVQHANFAPLTIAGALPVDLAAPIAGVDLALYAKISAGLARFGYDQAKAPELAAAEGIDGASWQQAMDGWNGRIAANPAVAREFNALYTGRA